MQRPGPKLDFQMLICHLLKGRSLVSLCPQCLQDRLMESRPDSTSLAYPPRSARLLPVRSLNHVHQDHPWGKNADPGPLPHPQKPSPFPTEF